VSRTCVSSLDYIHSFLLSITRLTYHTTPHHTTPILDELVDYYVKGGHEFASKPWWSSEDAMDLGTIYRFIAGQQFHVEKAKALLNKHIEWRKSYLPVELTPAVKTELSKGFIYEEGQDIHGNSIFVIRIDRFDKSNRDIEAACKAVVYVNEEIFSKKEKRGKFVKVTLLWSKVTFRTNNIDLEFLKALIGVMQDNYPERLQYLILYPTNRLFVGLWNVVKEWLPRRTSAKMKLLYSTDELSTVIDPSQRSQHHGGTLASELNQSQFKLTSLEYDSKTKTFVIGA
jgi:hypothetical protein